MNRKITSLIIALAVFSVIVSIAMAQIRATVEVKDSHGNVINGQIVHLNSVVSVHGYYVDTDGNADATAKIDVYVNGQYKETIWQGTVHDGQTIDVLGYSMNQLGVYEFRWTCQRSSLGAQALLCSERAQARTSIQLAVPEPGTIVGLAMGLSALGFLFVKKLRTKQA